MCPFPPKAASVLPQDICTSGSLSVRFLPALPAAGSSPSRPHRVAMWLLREMSLLAQEAADWSASASQAHVFLEILGHGLTCVVCMGLFVSLTLTLRAGTRSPYSLTSRGPGRVSHLCRSIAGRIAQRSPVPGASEMGADAQGLNAPASVPRGGCGVEKRSLQHRSPLSSQAGFTTHRSDLLITSSAVQPTSAGGARACLRPALSVDSPCLAQASQRCPPPPGGLAPPDSPAKTR